MAFSDWYVTHPEDALRPQKASMVIQVSDEMLHGPSQDRSGHVEPPTTEELAAYNEWKMRFKPLYKKGIKKGWFRDGGPDYGAEYEPPRGRWVYDDEDKK